MITSGEKSWSVTPSLSSSSCSSASSSSLLPSVSPSSWLTQARKKRKATTVIGNKEGGSLEGVPPRVKDSWDVFVSNLTETTSDFQLKTFLQEHGIEVKEVWLLNSKKKGTKSAKVRVAAEHKNKVKDAGVWPKYIWVQDWQRKPRLDV